MQLYALDGSQPVLAEQANKKRLYLCPECQAILKMRAGPSRQPHFYHLRHTKACRQHTKSEEHIALQLKLLRLIGCNMAQMERPFPAIHRIADVAWEEQKLIFEIQCSFISLEEAKARCEDYQKIGYHVLWILHEKQFNKKNCTAAELYLRARGCYFTNVNKIGQGTIYDQFEVLREARRLFKGPQLPCQLSAPFPLPQIATPDLALPKQVLQRLAEWKYGVVGDLLHRLLQEKTLQKTAARLVEMETNYFNFKSNAARLPWPALITKGYTALLQAFLRKAST